MTERDNTDFGNGRPQKQCTFCQRPSRDGDKVVRRSRHEWLHESCVEEQRQYTERRFREPIRTSLWGA